VGFARFWRSPAEFSALIALLENRALAQIMQNNAGFVSEFVRNQRLA
jgi:hypothetical protein